MGGLGPQLGLGYTLGNKELDHACQAQRKSQVSLTRTQAG